MSFSVSGTKITMTRGDTARFNVAIKYQANGVTYHPAETDRIRFSVKKYLSDKSPIIVKEVPVLSMILVIDPQDTENLSFGIYHYDMELVKENGDTETFITDSVLELTSEVS